MELGDLPAANLFRRVGSGLEHSEQSAFAEDDELVISEDGGAAAVGIGRFGRTLPSFVAFPHQLSGAELDAAKAGVRFIAPAETIEITLVINGSGPMDFEGGAAPDGFDGAAIGCDAQKHRTHLVISRGNKNLVPYHDGICGVDGFFELRAEPVVEIDLAGGGFERHQALTHETEQMRFS